MPFFRKGFRNEKPSRLGFLGPVGWVSSDPLVLGLHQTVKLSTVKEIAGCDSESQQDASGIGEQMQLTAEEPAFFHHFFFRSGNPENVA